MNESNFGNILREARERSGEDLMSVARKLRIRPDCGRKRPEPRTTPGARFPAFKQGFSFGRLVVATFSVAFVRRLIV